MWYLPVNYSSRTWGKDAECKFCRKQLYWQDELNIGDYVTKIILWSNNRVHFKGNVFEVNRVRTAYANHCAQYFSIFRHFCFDKYVLNKASALPFPSDLLIRPHQPYLCPLLPKGGSYIRTGRPTLTGGSEGMCCRSTWLH